MMIMISEAKLNKSEYELGGVINFMPSYQLDNDAILNKYWERKTKIRH